MTPKPLYEGALKSTLKLGEGQSSQTPTDAAISFASMFKTATQSVYAQPFSQSVFLLEFDYSLYTHLGFCFKMKPISCCIVYIVYVVQNKSV